MLIFPVIFGLRVFPDQTEKKQEEKNEKQWKLYKKNNSIYFHHINYVDFIVCRSLCKTNLF